MPIVSKRKEILLQIFDTLTNGLHQKLGNGSTDTSYCTFFYPLIREIFNLVI